MQIVDGFSTIDSVDEYVSRLDRIGAECGCAIQAFDARYVAGPRHVAAAIDHANQAVDHDDMIASDRTIEILCYAAGRRQIDRALEIGVRPGADPVPVVIVIDGDDEPRAAGQVREFVTDDSVLGVKRDPPLIREYYGITDAEVDATDASLEDLVIERVALLAIEK